MPSASLLRRYLPRPEALLSRPEASPPACASPAVASPASPRHLRRTVAPAYPPLDKVLLRRSVDEQAAHRHRCVHCGRTPLTGEVVHVYAIAAVERLVCELCRPLRREPPTRSELMHAPEHERSVRLTSRAA